MAESQGQDRNEGTGLRCRKESNATQYNKKFDVKRQSLQRKTGFYFQNVTSCARTNKIKAEAKMTERGESASRSGASDFKNH
jgi:hypothetical protein